MSLLTKRFPTVLGLLLLLAAIAGAIYYFKNSAVKISTDTVPAKVRITNISDNKFTVSWTTQSPTIGQVEYGLVGEKITNVAKDERDRDTQGKYQTHHITINELQPNTQYAFRILSGEKLSRFDNSGSPYTTKTGSVIGAIPPSNNFYGNIELSSKQPATGSIVYLTLPNASTASTIVSEAGTYTFTLSTIRTDDNQKYIDFDPAATIASLLVESGKMESIVNVSLANSAPVPAITLGKNEDFLNLAQAPDVAQVEIDQVPATTDAAPEPSAAPLEIFNVEPLAAEPADINAVTTTSVTILNPKEAGEVLKTLRPEFRGTGPAGTTLSVALTGQKAISDTIQVATDSTWSWTPVIDLKTGKQNIAISYTGAGGTKQKIEREFSISTSTTGLDPAFVSSPSASVKTGTTTASTKPVSASPSPRIVMPDTTDGTPVTGVIENTLLTAGLGIVIMVVGAALLVL